MRYTHQDVAPFVDGLQDILPAKLAEIMAEMDTLVTDRTEMLDVIRTVKMREGEDEMRDYVAIMYAGQIYVRYAQLKKQLRHYLRLMTLIDEPTKQAVQNTTPKSHFDEATLDRARSFPIQDLYGGRLHGTEHRLVGLCPFHEERHPSFVIFTTDNHYYCFGCGANGDSIDFLIGTKKLSFREAVEALL